MNFLACDREQVLLMPPDLRDWLPEDHLAWFVLASVEEMDLSAFYASYRPDGHGRAAHDPAMMVALLLYAYSMGQRSSRVIERECVEDIAYRVIAANRKPDHATLARFVVRHEAAVAGLFGEVLSLCADAGMVKVGVVAIDGTKVHANASQHSNRDYEQIAKEILAERRRPTVSRTSSTAISAGTSCRRSWRPGRVAGRGCATRGVGWMRSVRRIPSQCRAHGPND
jgi:transposase